MIAKSLFLIFIFLAMHTKQQQQQSRVGFAYAPYPDVIKCGNHFYYLSIANPALSKFNAFTG